MPAPLPSAWARPAPAPLLVAGAGLGFLASAGVVALARASGTDGSCMDLARSRSRDVVRCTAGWLSLDLRARGALPQHAKHSHKGAWDGAHGEEMPSQTRVSELTLEVEQ